MWEINSWFPSQLSLTKIYAYIETIVLDLNARNPSTDNYVPSSLTCTEHLYGSSDLTSLFNLYLIEVNTFNPSPTHVQQYDGPSNYHTLKHSSLRQSAWCTRLLALPRLIKDIMDNIKSEEWYDAPLTEDFNMGD